MGQQSCCGCPVPIINPPDLGAEVRLALRPVYVSQVPLVDDPGLAFPKLLTASHAAWQGTSLGCEPEFCGWQPRHPMMRGMPLQVFASYRNYALNFAAGEVAKALGQVMYPVPGIWLGPVRIHLPSGNVLMQFSALICGPFDAVPVFSYNSMASRENAGRGLGVSDLFNPSVEEAGDGVTNLITGTGKFLEYTGVDVDVWGTAPGSARNGLKKLSGGGWVERQPDSLQWYYDTDGFATKIVSPSGDTWTITRNSECLVETIAGPYSRVTTITGTGGTYVVTQPDSKVTTFVVSANELTAVQYPGGANFALGYDANHLLDSITDPEGNLTTLSYDTGGRAKSVSFGGKSYTLKYIDSSYGPYKFIEVTDPASQVTTIAHDCNLVYSVVNPLGQRTTYVWESAEDPRLVAIVDAESNRTTLGYATLFDGSRALSSIERPEIGSLSFGYGSNGRCNSITDFDGNATALSWDGQDRREAVFDAEGGRFTFMYNSHAQMTAAIDPLNARRTITYDSSGNVSCLENELGNRTTFTYEPDGSVESLMNPLGEVTTYARDDIGRLEQITDPLAHSRSYAYDDLGRLKAFTNGNSERTTFTYDGQNQLTAQIDPLSHTNSFGYDSRGNWITSVNGESECTTFVYNAGSRRTGQINPLNFVSTYTHDNVGNVRSSMNPEGETTQYSYDKVYRQTKLTTPLGFVTSYTYNHDGLQRTITNAEGECTTSVYNGLNQIESVVDPLGHSVDSTYDEVHRLQMVINAESETTEYVYDAAGQRTAVINPLGERTTSIYDAAGRVKAVQNPLGYRTTSVYDAAGRAVAVRSAINLLTTTTYDSADRPIAVTNPENETTSTVYDAAGRVWAKVNALSFRTTFAYDAANRPLSTQNAEDETSYTAYDDGGRVTRKINPLGFVTSFSYDRADRQTEVQDAEGARTTTVYDDDGRATQVINARSKSTLSQYDRANRVTLTIDAYSAMTQRRYDQAGRPQAVIDPLGNCTTTLYDSANRPTATINPLGKCWTTTYDDAGRVIAQTDPLLHTSTTTYDAAGQVTGTTNAAGDQTVNAYDPAGRQSAMVNGNAQVTTYEYDQADRRTAVVNPLGQRVTTVYQTSRVIATVNEKGKRTTTTYDNVDRPLTETNPLAQMISYVYDDAGRRLQQIDACGQVTTYTYDKVDRQTLRQYTDGTSVAQGYDAVGNRTSMIDSTGRYTYTYDYVDRPETTIDAHGKTINYEYYANGLRKRMIDPDSQVTTYLYDAAGQLKTLTSPASERTSLSYDEAGRRTTSQLANGTTNQTGYDPADRVNWAKTTNSSSAVLGEYVYTLDGEGNRTSMLDDTGQMTNWPLDALGQLRADYYLPFSTGLSWATLALSQWDALALSQWDTLPLDSASLQSGSGRFAFDPAGNRLTHTDALTGDITTYTYDDANQLLTAEDPSGVTTYTYDANGNRLTIEEPLGDITTNTWNGENRLVQVEHDGGETVEYAYNGDGLMVEKTIDGTDTTRYVYDGNNVLQETDGAGTKEADMTYVPDTYGEAISQRRGSDSSFYHFDGTKNVRQLTDGSESVTDEYQHDAWGEPMSSTGTTANSQRYKGQLMAYREDPDAAPEAQLALHHRHYDPQTGTFSSRDPAEDDPNLYRYVKNNPVNREDPSGLGEFESETWSIEGPIDDPKTGLRYFKVWSGWTKLASLLGTVVYDPAKLSDANAYSIAEGKQSSGVEFGALILQGPEKIQALRNSRLANTGLGLLYGLLGGNTKGYISDEHQRRTEERETAIAAGKALRSEIFAEQGIKGRTLETNVEFYNQARNLPFIGTLSRIAFGEYITEGETKSGAVQLGSELLIAEGGKLLAAAIPVATIAKASIRGGIISKVDEALGPLAKQFPDAKVGFRGSLARGTKGPHKGGGPFDPTNFDVDAFIVSDELATAIPTDAKGFRNLGRLPEHRSLIKSISDKLRGIPGHRDVAVRIRVYSVNEFKKLLPDEIHLLN